MNSIIFESSDNKIKIIDLNKEYNGYNKETPYAIVTDLSEDKLNNEYGELTHRYRPFVIITCDMFNAMYESYLNDHREQWREGHLHDTLGIDAAKFLVDELNDPVRICESLYVMDCIFKRIINLPGNIGSRVYKRYVIGFTAREIAVLEGSSYDEVRKSLFRAKPVLRIIFAEEGGVA